MAVLTNATPKLVSVPLAPGTLQLRKPLRPGEARALWMEEKPTEDVVTWSAFSQQARANAALLEDIRRALQTPAAHAGSRTSLLHSPRINFVSIRIAAQWLSGAAIVDLHEGHLESALENIEALAALAQLHREESLLVSQMIRVAVAGSRVDNHLGSPPDPGMDRAPARAAAESLAGPRPAPGARNRVRR